jgi:hypothetical protein
LLAACLSQKKKGDFLKRFRSCNTTTTTATTTTHYTNSSNEQTLFSIVDKKGAQYHYQFNQRQRIIMTACVRVALVLFLCLSLATEETEGFIVVEPSSSKTKTIHSPPTIVSNLSTHRWHCMEQSKKFQQNSMATFALFASNENNNNSNNNSKTENETTPPTTTGRMEAIGATSVPLASYFLLFVTVRSARQLLTLPTEIPGAFLFGSSGQQSQSIDYLGFNRAELSYVESRTESIQSRNILYSQKG